MKSLKPNSQSGAAVAIFALVLVALSGCTGGDDNTLRIGTLMPSTGQLSAYGPDGDKAVQLAIKHVNDADVGLRAVLVGSEDDKSVDTAGASAAFERLVNKGASVVIGSYASSVTDAILAKAKEAGVVVITPASTSPQLTEQGRDNGGYFFRIPPSDALQGRVLADLMIQDNRSSVNVIAVNNAYGNGLGGVFRSSFEAHGGSVGQFVTYSETAPSFSSEVEQVGSGSPDAILLVGYVDDGAAIMQEAYARGISADTAFYFSEGVQNPDFVTKAGADDQGVPIVAGFKGTTPNLGAPEFEATFEAEYGHTPALFAAQAYDGVIYAALAALKGGQADANAVREHFREVANSPGEKIDQAAPALRAVAEGNDVDYVGVSHDFNFNADGDPTDGVYDVWHVTQEGEIETLQSGIRPSS